MTALERRRVSLIQIVADVEPDGLLRGLGHGTVDGEHVVVHAVKSGVRS